MSQSHELGPEQSNIGLKASAALVFGNLLASAMLLMPGSAAAQENDNNVVDAEKDALNSFEPISRTINSFASPAEDSSTTSTSEAQTSSLQQDCIKAALKKPKIRYAAMIYPGDRRKQTLGTEITSHPTSPACVPIVSQGVSKIIFKVENPKNPNKYFSSTPQIFKGEDNQPVGDEGGIGKAYLYLKGSRGKNKKLDYRCTDGTGVTGVQAEIQLTTNSAVDGQTLATKSYNIGVPVKPVPGFAPVQGGGVKKAC